MNESIQERIAKIYGQPLKMISGILKSNEIPNAEYCISRDKLIICLYNTCLYVMDINDIGDIIPFILSINENKELIPMIPFNYIQLQDKLLQFYSSCINRELLASIDDLKSDPEFAELLTMKAADGMRFYKVPTLNPNAQNKMFFVPVYSGFPNLAKSDNASIRIYNAIESNCSIVEYIIWRQKVKSYIHLYFRILNL